MTDTSVRISAERYAELVQTEKDWQFIAMCFMAYGEREVVQKRLKEARENAELGALVRRMIEHPGMALYPAGGPSGWSTHIPHRGYKGEYPSPEAALLDALAWRKP